MLIKHKFAHAGLLSCLLVSAIALPHAASAQDSVQTQSRTISYNGKSFTAQWISVDLTDPYIRVKPVTADAGIGHDESFSSMMARSHAVAGINGTFFDSYEKDDTKRYPNGLIIGSGDIVHSGSNSSFLVLADKTAALGRIASEQQITVTHQGKPYTFTAWGVNKYYGDSVDDQVVWYTGAFGKRVDFPNSTKVVIQEGKITAVTQDGARIPEDGHILLIGGSANNSTNVLPNIHVGDSIKLATTLSNQDSGSSIALPAVDAAVGAGPGLLTNGQIDIDFARDGITETKITTAANIRSFIGVDASNRLIMGTLSTAKISDMAGVLLQLGLTDAMNLDGGASSALFANGSILRNPGRALSNALVVERLEQPQIQVDVNGQFVHEFRGYLQQETSMVPFRGILERIGAQFEWNGTARTLTVQYGANRLQLQPDHSVMLWNGKSVVLPAAPTIVDGHIYMPLRAIMESLGGQVRWDPQLYRASLTF
ncbi:stalk domain-containing protein [Paenibacillus sedimenti]|uniref:Phosphodiester glycosidase family protein n=1 Tax=Paenibacillus sedimenti TaxID=2770274 RepID=A0A926QL86_9BACL|nr:phosphodiester glycosidase family protein [Paenibacillus sedimenti]MBD0383636.1 phosphodiester glycosidase family protein [Paenibacillus sedimenti]